MVHIVVPEPDGIEYPTLGPQVCQFIEERFVFGPGSLAGQRKVHGRWPGLAPEQLHEGRDLALTTDMRSVFSEVCSKHLGAEKLSAIFPGYAVRTGDWLGVV